MVMSQHKVRNMYCVLPKKILNVEVDNDVNEIVCVLLTAEVVPCFLSLAAPVFDVPLTDSGYMCSPCCPERFDSQPEQFFCHASDTRKLLNTLFSKNLQTTKKETLHC